MSYSSWLSHPISLINIYKELAQSVEDFATPDHGYLMGWAKQGKGR